MIGHGAVLRLLLFMLTKHSQTRKGSHWSQTLHLLSAEHHCSRALIGSALASLATAAEWEKSLVLLSASLSVDVPSRSSTILACEQGLAWRMVLQLTAEAAGGLDSSALMAPVRCALNLHAPERISCFTQLACSAVEQAAMVSSEALAEQESTLTFLLHLRLLPAAAPLCRAFHRRVTSTVRTQLQGMAPHSGVLLANLSDLGPVLSRDVLSPDAKGSDAFKSWRRAAAASVTLSFMAQPWTSPVRPVARQLRTWLSAGLLHGEICIEMHEIVVAIKCLGSNIGVF